MEEQRSISPLTKPLHSGELLPRGAQMDLPAQCSTCSVLHIFGSLDRTAQPLVASLFESLGIIKLARPSHKPDGPSSMPLSVYHPAIRVCCLDLRVLGRHAPGPEPSSQCRHQGSHAVVMSTASSIAMLASAP
jgi:hypothetical protein